jgi:excisionase family DNA binding protein
MTRGRTMTTLSTPMLTTAEVARRMRVTTGTVRRWRLDDVGPRFIQVGNIYRYPLDQLEAWMREKIEHSLDESEEREEAAPRRPAHDRRRGEPRTSRGDVLGAGAVDQPRQPPPRRCEARLRQPRGRRGLARQHAAHRQDRRRQRPDARRLRRGDRRPLDPRHRPALHLRPVCRGVTSARASHTATCRSR